MFTNNHADAGDDRGGVGCEEVDFDLNLRTDAILVVELKQDARDAQVDHPPRLPFGFTNRPYPYRPSDGITACATVVDTCHTTPTAKSGAFALTTLVPLNHRNRETTE